MYEPIHTRQTADLEVAIWIDPDERLSVRVSDAGGDFRLPARDGHDALEKFWHPYLGARHARSKVVVTVSETDRKRGA